MQIGSQTWGTNLTKGQGWATYVGSSKRIPFVDADRISNMRNQLVKKAGQGAPAPKLVPSPFWVRRLIDYIEALKCLDFNSETLNWCKLEYSWILRFFTVVPLWVLVHPKPKSQCIFFLIKTTQNGSEHRCQRWEMISNSVKIHAVWICQPFEIMLSSC